MRKLKSKSPVRPSNTTRTVSGSASVPVRDPGELAPGEHGVLQRKDRDRDQPVWRGLAEVVDPVVVGGGEDPRGIASFMFGPYALPLQVLSAALLVALVGALVLAKPEREEEERP
jgi:hypothetical protein